MTSKNIWMILGCISAFLGVALGAFGAHSLSQRLSEKSMAIYQTAVHYQLFHSLALLAFGLWIAQHPQASAAPGIAFSLGILLFSGSLYLLALTGIGVFGATTPLGGIGFLLGWILFTAGLLKT